MNDDSIGLVFNTCFRKFSNEMSIPKEYLFIDYVDLFQKTCNCYNRIDSLLKSGQSFDNSIIIDILNESEMKRVALSFLNENAFKKITISYLLSMGNSIIDYCSVYNAFSMLTNAMGYDFIQISEETEQMLKMITQNNGSNAKINKFAQINIENEIDDLINDTIYMKQEICLKLKKKLDFIKSLSHVCCCCNECPACSVLVPCGHTFFCEQCLKGVLDSGNIRCFVCGSFPEDIIIINQSKITPNLF